MKMIFMKIIEKIMESHTFEFKIFMLILSKIQTLNSKKNCLTSGIKHCFNAFISIKK